MHHSMCTSQLYIFLKRFEVYQIKNALQCGDATIPELTWLKCQLICLCLSAYSTKVQIRDGNRMKPTAYEYEHSKLKPNTAFGFAQKFSPSWLTNMPSSISSRRQRQQHSKTLSEIPSFRVQITLSSPTSKSTPLVHVAHSRLEFQLL